MSIPIDSIKTISLEYGSPVERPITELLIGTLLIGLGCIFGVLPAYGIFVRGYVFDIMGTMVISSALSMLFLGGWFVLRLFAKEYFLKIETEKDSRKIVFDSFLYEYEVKSFVSEVKERFGLNISNSVI